MIAGGADWDGAGACAAAVNESETSAGTTVSGKRFMGVGRDRNGSSNVASRSRRSRSREIRDLRLPRDCEGA